MQVNFWWKNENEKIRQMNKIQIQLFQLFLVLPNGVFISWLLFYYL